MPGLYALSSWEALPLKSSKVKACANGYSLSITAHLVYTNPHEEPVEGIFIYPLEESEVVAGFEAAVGSRRVTFQVQNRPRGVGLCGVGSLSKTSPKCGQCPPRMVSLWSLHASRKMQAPFPRHPLVLPPCKEALSQS
uniref:VIT domain-containing protein n=1 Tax=Bubo bubo TaxID=30461 RepID=A0A8C0FTG9_BUBBB